MYLFVTLGKMRFFWAIFKHCSFTKQEWNRRIKDDSVLNAIICPEWIEQFSIMIEKVLRWNHHHHHYYQTTLLRQRQRRFFTNRCCHFFFLEHLLLQGGSKLRVNVYFPRSNRLFIFGSKKLRDLLKNPVSGTILPGL